MTKRLHFTPEEAPSAAWVVIACVTAMGCAGVRPHPDRSTSQTSTATAEHSSKTVSEADRTSSDSEPPSSSSAETASVDETRRLERSVKRADRRTGRARRRAVERTSRWANRRLPTRYPVDRALSPITSHVAEHFQTIASRAPEARDDVFAKVGGSNTVNPNFMQCFADREDVDLAGRDHLQPAIEFFADDGPGEPNPYTRDSKAAKVGWSAMNVLKGDPPHLVREVRAIRPRFAVVMYGTNDIGWRGLDAYAEDVFRIVDTLTRRGVIPILTSIPPRGDDPKAAEKVPQFNAVLRGIAQRRQIPFIDLNRRLRQLPERGLGGDGLHMTALAGAYFQPCVFTDEGLKHGHNTRNLLTLEMLDRLRRVVVEGADAPDPLDHPPQAADGTPSDPIAIGSLPYVGGRDTSNGGSTRLDRYEGCGGTRDQSGPEFVYELHLDETTRLRASVVDRRGSDLDLHLLDTSTEASNCRRRADHTIEATLSAGTHHLVVDTFVDPNEGPRPGEFVLTVREQPMQMSRRSP